MAGKRKSGKVAALVLPKRAVVTTEAQTFGVFPGVWVPGKPVAVSELGFDSDQEALQRAEDLGLPLEPAELAEGQGEMPVLEEKLESAPPGEFPVAEEPEA